MSASDQASPSSSSSEAWVSSASPLSLASALMVCTESAERKSSQLRTPSSHMAFSFFAPTDGRIWKVCVIMDPPV